MWCSSIRPAFLVLQDLLQIVVLLTTGNFILFFADVSDVHGSVKCVYRERRKSFSRI